MELSQGQAAAVVFDVQFGDVEKDRAAVFHRVVKDDVFRPQPGGEQAELELADPGIEAGLLADAVLSEISGDIVFQEEKPDAQHQCQEQEAERPAKDELDHAGSMYQARRPDSTSELRIRDCQLLRIDHPAYPQGTGLAVLLAFHPLFGPGRSHGTSAATAKKCLYCGAF